jgi:hypothetical protein
MYNIGQKIKTKGNRKRKLEKWNEPKDKAMTESILTHIYAFAHEHPIDQTKEKMWSAVQNCD